MKKYDSYKDSGVSWIGKIPDHWDLRRMRFVAKLYNGNSLNDTEKSRYADVPDDDESVPYIASKDIDRDTEFIDYANGIRIPKTEKDFKVAPAGTSLLCIEGGSAGKKMGFVEQDVCFVNKLCCFDASINNKFLYYYIKSKSFWEVFSQNIQGMIGGVTISRIKDFAVPIPFENEQNALVEYLDDKCSEVDKIIASQEKKKKCLEELRRNIITKSVTQGINNGVYLKNTGVEWIGDIPHHWTLKKMKFLLNLLTDYDANGSFSDIAKNCKINNGNPYAWMVRMTDLESKRYGLVEGNNYCDQATYKYLSKSSLVSGDIIIAKRGSIGKSYLIPKCDCPMTLAPNTYLLKTKSNVVNNRFLFYYLSSSPGIINLEFLNKSTTLGAIYKDDVKAMLIPLPEMKEQDEIVNYLDSKVSKLEMMIESVDLTIKKLYKYKQSLITEVVTGERKVC